jgi:hypothetical protein
LLDFAFALHERTKKEWLLALRRRRIRNMAAEIKKEIELEIAPVLFIAIVGLFEVLPLTSKTLPRPSLP